MARLCDVFVMNIWRRNFLWDEFKYSALSHKINKSWVALTSQFGVFVLIL